MSQLLRCLTEGIRDLRRLRVMVLVFIGFSLLAGVAELTQLAWRGVCPAWTAAFQWAFIIVLHLTTLLRVTATIKTTTNRIYELTH